MVIERKYGSLEAIQIQYETIDNTATAGYDYQPVIRGTVILAEGQKSIPVFIQVSYKHYIYNISSILDVYYPNKLLLDIRVMNI